jgi:hypothetical protein
LEGKVEFILNVDGGTIQQTEVTLSQE